MEAGPPTKQQRLHISGLTAAISEKDLAGRMSAFGAVKSIEGFGALDGNGDFRKFAFATLEADPSKVSRCMNALSGTTWKGARLRVALARPDFRARLEAERAAPPVERASRRRVRGAHGVLADDMSPVTRENAGERKGWVTTPLGYLVRPMRMRPERPLPPPSTATRGTTKTTTPGKGKKQKKARLRDPLTRARRRTIDPTRWGAVHLSGALLTDSIVAAATPNVRKTDAGSRTARTLPRTTSPAEPQEATRSDTAETDEVSDEEIAVPKPTETPATKQHPPLTANHTKGKQKAEVDPLAHTLRGEVSQSLDLLHSLFGGQDEWGGAESIDDAEELQGVGESEADDAGSQANGAMDADEDEDQGEDEDGLIVTRLDPDRMDEDTPADAPAASASAAASDAALAPAATPAPAVHAQALKDMFAPRADDGGFSLFASLDIAPELDLDLDMDLTFAPPTATTNATAPAPAPALAPAPAPIAPGVPAAAWASAAHARPLFFPAGGRGDVLAALAADGFWRTESADAIRARWEARRGALTAEWKARSRDARRRGRRGGRVDAEEGA